VTDLSAPILAEVPNSGIVQLPGRRFPGVVVQGDSLSAMFDELASALGHAKNRRDEGAYYATFAVASQLQDLLAAYENTLGAIGSSLPYSESIKTRQVHDDFAP
jgi:hypothetical protein